jgi:hypothetical protein
MSTERFKFNAKPGEPGFQELKKNKYGHTVLNSGDEESQSDNVAFSIDPETGTPRADLSIWDTQEMRNLADKLNMPLDVQVTQDVKEDAPVGVTDQDMDDLLLTIEQDLTPPSERLVVASTIDYLAPETNLVAQDSRVRKVSKIPLETDCQSKICTDESCGAALPFNAKFCSTCGKLQKITLFCIECGRKFNEREKFCADCGGVRE